MFNLKLPEGQSTGLDRVVLGPEFNRFVSFDQDGEPVMILPGGVTIRSGVVPDAEAIDAVRDFFLNHGGRLKSAL